MCVCVCVCVRVRPRDQPSHRCRRSHADEFVSTAVSLNYEERNLPADRPSVRLPSLILRHFRPLTLRGRRRSVWLSHRMFNEFSRNGRLEHLEDKGCSHSALQFLTGNDHGGDTFDSFLFSYPKNIKRNVCFTLISLTIKTKQIKRYLHFQTGMAVHKIWRSYYYKSARRREKIDKE